jgi:hypothetical protein
MKEGLKFAVAAGGISEKDAEFLIKDSRQRFIDMAFAQGRRVEEERPANRFVEGLRAALNMGGAMLRNKADFEVRDPGPGKVASEWNDFKTGIFSWILCLHIKWWRHTITAQGIHSQSNPLPSARSEAHGIYRF